MGLIGLNHLASYVLFGYLLYHMFFLHLFRVSSLDCNSRFASLCNSCSLLFSPSGASLCFVCVSNFRLISSRKPQPWKTAHCDMSEELHGALDGQYHRLYKKMLFLIFCNSLEQYQALLWHRLLYRPKPTGYCISMIESQSTFCDTNCHKLTSVNARERVRQKDPGMPMYSIVIILSTVTN